MKTVSIVISQALQKDNQAMIQTMPIPKAYEGIDENGLECLRSMYQYSYDTLAVNDVEAKITANNAEAEAISESIQSAKDSGENVIEYSGEEYTIEELVERLQELHKASSFLCESKDILLASADDSEYKFKPCFIVLQLVASGFVRGGKISERSLSRLAGLVDTLKEYHSNVLTDTITAKEYRAEATKGVNTLLTISPAVQYVNTSGEKVAFPAVEYKNIPAYLWESLRSAPTAEYVYLFQNEKVNGSRFVSVSGTVQRERKIGRLVKSIMLPVLYWQNVRAVETKVTKQGTSMLDDVI